MNEEQTEAMYDLLEARKEAVSKLRANLICGDPASENQAAQIILEQQRKERWTTQDTDKPATAADELIFPDVETL
jgi:hypothetical protein